MRSRRPFAGSASAEAKDLPPIMRPILSGLRAAIEGNREETIEHAEASMKHFMIRKGG